MKEQDKSNPVTNDLEDLARMLFDEICEDPEYPGIATEVSLLFALSSIDAAKLQDTYGNVLLTILVMRKLNHKTYNACRMIKMFLEAEPADPVPAFINTIASQEPRDIVNPEFCEELLDKVINDHPWPFPEILIEPED